MIESFTSAWRDSEFVQDALAQLKRSLPGIDYFVESSVLLMYH